MTSAKINRQRKALALVQQRSVHCYHCDAKPGDVCVNFHGEGLRYIHVLRARKFERVVADKVPGIHTLGTAFSVIEARKRRVDKVLVHPDDFPRFFGRTAIGVVPDQFPTPETKPAGYLWNAEIVADASIDRSQDKVIGLVSEATDNFPEEMIVWV